MPADDQPDHDEDPRGTDTGAGYPEEQPDGANPGPPSQKPGAGGGGDAPDTDGDDSGPETATGNPKS